jgi:hypothetical protein
MCTHVLGAFTSIQFQYYFTDGHKRTYNLLTYNLQAFISCSLNWAACTEFPLYPVSIN